MALGNRSGSRKLAFLVAFLALAMVMGNTRSGTAAPPALEPGAVEGLAASPPVLNYQGRLVDPATGNPKNGTFPMVFRLYAVDAGGTALWTESRNVVVANGLFTVPLGDVTPLNLTHFDGNDRWLGVQVGADPEATPRMRLAYAPYALHAETAAQAGNADLLDGMHAGDLANVKFFTLELFAAYLDGGATFSTGYGPFAGMGLPDSGVPNFSYAFTIPPDYTPGTDLVVRFLWHTSATNCSVLLAPNYISVARAGRTHIVGPSTDSGLAMVGGNLLGAGATPNLSLAKDVTITTPVPGTDLMPGDTIIFGLYRSAANPSDTCASDLRIQGVRIAYQ